LSKSPFFKHFIHLAVKLAFDLARHAHFSKIKTAQPQNQQPPNLWLRIAADETLAQHVD